MPCYAHSRPNGGVEEEWDLLENHLRQTAFRCEHFSSGFSIGAGFLAGLWHDLGKYQPEFQRYIRNNSDAGFDDVPRVNHSFVGAQHAFERFQNTPLDFPIAAVIAAHHGRLRDASDVVNALLDPPAYSIPDAPRNLLEHSLRPEDSPSYPPKDATALWTRFLYSALVDADSLVTEEWDKGLPRWRCPLTPGELLSKLERYLEALAQRTEEPLSTMNQLRRQVQDACWKAAAHDPGAFRLTVPTGGGKTLASVFFALRHASIHGLQRVIVVIPYTSIIEQTAGVYRNIFGDDVVLEHQSSIDPDKENRRNRHCVENWDSPIVVTTSVQFFESLHANRKRDLRKLHNIAESVVVMDEVQTFPLPLIRPIHEVLKRLTQHFRVTTVHCSATQPLLAQPDAQEIVPNPESLFSLAKHRVRVHWPGDISQPTSWTQLAERIRGEKSDRVLAIVHARRDAIELAQSVGPHCIHLSTLMCPKHRRVVLREIRKRLEKAQPCVVVSTQLVEAGVDIDFPVVYRALAGVDGLAQAAGRCNREGKLGQPGDFHVFVAPSKPPQGTPRQGFDEMKYLISQERADLFDPQLSSRYFSNLIGKFPNYQDSPISAAEGALRFQQVADMFKMIEDHGVSVIAPYDGWVSIVKRVRASPGIQSFRQLQPYTVNVPERRFETLRSAGALVPLMQDSEAPDSERCWIVLAGNDSVYSDRFGFGTVDRNVLLEA